MMYLLDMEDNQTRRSVRVYNIQGDFRREDKGKFMATTSAQSEHYFQTRLAAIKWAAEWIIQ